MMTIRDRVGMSENEKYEAKAGLNEQHHQIPSVLCFESYFLTATGHTPFPFQCDLATSIALPDMIEIPTGMGKTDSIILGWLWRMRFDSREEIRTTTPRRQIYCLPMRVLVEQTREKARTWLNNLGILGEKPGDESPLLGFSKERHNLLLINHNVTILKIVIVSLTTS